MWWPWRLREPAAWAGEPEEEQGPAAGHHRHLHIEHDGDVETESASSEHWLGVPVEEAVHVEDPAGDRTSSNGADDEAMAPASEGDCSDDESVDGQAGEADGGRIRRSGRGRKRRRIRRRRRGGSLPVTTVVAVLLALVAAVASWRRRLRWRRGVVG